MKVWRSNLKIIEETLRNYNVSYEEYLKEKYRKYKYICIFGAGNIGIATAQELINLGVCVNCFIDNNADKTGKEILGLPCYLPEYLEEIKSEAIIIVSTRYYKEIREQLTVMGVLNIDRVFINKIGLKRKIEKFGKEKIVQSIEDTVKILSDEKSKIIYTVILKNWLTLDYNQKELDEVCSYNQYFCEDIFQLSEEEHFIDGGAYDGDTIDIFLKQTKGKIGRGYLFELSQTNYKKMIENISKYDKEIQEKLICINKGLAEQSCIIQYNDADEGSLVDSEGEMLGEVTTVDEICEELPVTYIKLDIEGSEKQALVGSRQTISEKAPKLAVCLYHKFEDFWELPLLVHSLQPEYNIYIRHHTDLLNETVCYAVLEEKG